MDPFATLTIKIIKEQENIIGPIALEQAKKVSGLTLDWGGQKVSFSGDKTDIVNNLVKQYEHLFGKASIEVCKDAVRSLLSKIPPEKVPYLLR